MNEKGLDYIFVIIDFFSLGDSLTTHVHIFKVVLDT